MGARVGCRRRRRCLRICCSACCWPGARGRRCCSRRSGGPAGSTPSHSRCSPRLCCLPACPAAGCDGAGECSLLQSHLAAPVQEVSGQDCSEQSGRGAGGARPAAAGGSRSAACGHVTGLPAARLPACLDACLPAGATPLLRTSTCCPTAPPSRPRPCSKCTRGPALWRWVRWAGLGWAGLGCVMGASCGRLQHTALRADANVSALWSVLLTGLLLLHLASTWQQWRVAWARPPPAHHRLPSWRRQWAGPLSSVQLYSCRTAAASSTVRAPAAACPAPQPMLCKRMQQHCTAQSH